MFLVLTTNLDLSKLNFVSIFVQRCNLFPLFHVTFFFQIYVFYGSFQKQS